MPGRTKRNDVDIVLFDGPGEPSVSEALPPGTFILNERTATLYVRRQDMSLLCLSSGPAYGGLFLHDAVAGQVIATGAAQKMTGWTDSDPEAGGVDAQVADNQIVVRVAGVYLVGWHVSFITSGPARWAGHVYLNGADTTGVDWDRNVGGAGGPGSVSAAMPVPIPAGGIIAGYLSHDQVGNRTFTPADAQLYVVRVG